MVVRLFPPLITQQKQSLSSFPHLYVLCFQPVPDDSMEECFPAQYSYFLLYIWADSLQSMGYRVYTDHPVKVSSALSASCSDILFHHITLALPHRVCEDPIPFRP